MSDNLTDTQRYDQFLRKFLARYASLEETLRRVLHLHSGLDQERYNTLIGFPRAKDLVDKLRRLLALVDLESEGKALVSAALLQINEITKLRHDIVHYGAAETPNGELVIMRKPSEIHYNLAADQRLMTLGDFENVFSDLNRVMATIWYHLDYSLADVARPPLEREAHDSAPWLYKYPK